MARLVLASASPRRAQLLQDAGIAFEAQPADVDERPPKGVPPEEAAVEIAGRKAAAVEETGAWVLAADTLVVYERQLLGKPTDAMDAHATLRLLSGVTHDVFTGVVVRAPGGAVASGATRTQVTFRELSDEDIHEYVESGEPMDKAGAYGIQGRGESFVAKVEGPVDNVVGLPMELVRSLLAKSGFPLA